MQKFVPFSKAERRPEYLRQMPHNWYLCNTITETRADKCLRIGSYVCIAATVLLVVFGVI